MNTATILALDISSTHIGICYDGQILDTIKLPHKEDIAARCRVAAALIRGQLFLTPDVDLIVIERPAGRHAWALIQMARISGAVLEVVSHKQIAWTEISPSDAKKALTGKGNADKAMMIAAAMVYQPDIKPDEHQADAYGIWLAAKALDVEVGRGGG